MSVTTLPEGIHAVITAERKLDAVCDTGCKRYILGAVELIPANEGEVWATATDGKALSVVKTAGITEERKPYYLPAKLLRPTKKAATAKLNGRWESADRMADQPEGRFPCVHEVLPDCADRQTITLDAHLLSKLAEAISADGKVTLLIPPAPALLPDGRKAQHRSPIGVVGNDGFGVLFPCSDVDGAGNAYSSGRSSFTADRLTALESLKPAQAT